MDNTPSARKAHEISNRHKYSVQQQIRELHVKNKLEAQETRKAEQEIERIKRLEGKALTSKFVKKDNKENHENHSDSKQIQQEIGVIEGPTIGQWESVESEISGGHLKKPNEVKAAKAVEKWDFDTKVDSHVGELEADKNVSTIGFKKRKKKTGPKSG